jgi:hypothetical protein
MSLAHAYDSKLTKGFKVSDILLEISKSQLKMSGDPQRDIQQITEQFDVSPFFYPLYDKEHDRVHVDIRPFSSLQRDGSVKITNSLDEELYQLLARLELVWNRTDRPDQVYSSLMFANEIFIRWLSDTIGRRHGLTPYQSSRLTALCGMYCIGLYQNNLDDELAIDRHLQNLTRHVPVDFQVMKEVAERVENHFPRDIDEFVEAVRKLDLGPRLKDFNSTILYNLLNGSWWANVNSPQLVALGLEYPPAFAGMVYMATRHSFYKRTAIGDRTDRANRGSNYTNFHRALKLLIEKYTTE